MNFKKIIIELEKANLSQTEIAKKVSVSPGRISQIRNHPSGQAGLRGAATMKLLALHKLHILNAKS